MTFSSGIPAPTKAQYARFEMIRGYGCIACRQLMMRFTYPEVHHLTTRGRRIGHDYTIGLCSYHHRNCVLTMEFKTPSEAQAVLGTSLARSPATFHQDFGHDQDLLDQQNRAIHQPLRMIAAAVHERRSARVSKPNPKILPRVKP